MAVNGPTNRVRIALAINEFGQWSAYGRWDTRDDNAMEEANGNVSQDGPQANYFIEVDVPVPTRQILEAALGQIVGVVEPPKEEKK